MFQTERGVQKKMSKNNVPELLPPAFFSSKTILFAVLLTLAYLLFSFLLIGFQIDQLVLAGIFNLMYFASRTTRRFIIGFSIFIIYWIVFDYMKALPNYRYNTVHIESLYHCEKQLFGINWNNALLTPNEFFTQTHTRVLDILSGIFYLCWIPVPLFFAAVLFFKNRKYFFHFSLCFFLVNLLGFIVYYIYPAAPPWYVALHGFDFIAGTPGNTAGLVRFDAAVGMNVFKSIYSKSSNVFAAMPSLHASYMLIVVYYAVKINMKKIYTVLFAIILAGIWFSAVYSGHHYVLDVIAGIICAVAGIALLEYFVQKTCMGKRILQSLMTATSLK